MRAIPDVPPEDLAEHLTAMHVNSVGLELGDPAKDASLHLMAHLRGWFRHGTGQHVHRDPGFSGRL